MATKSLGIGDLQNFVNGSVDATAAEKIQFQKNAIPKLTTAQRDALTGANLFPGLLIYNTTTNKLNVRVAAAWEAITSA
jgi:hypothetical protein